MMDHADHDHEIKRVILSGRLRTFPRIGASPGQPTAGSPRPLLGRQTMSTFLEYALSRGVILPYQPPSSRQVGIGFDQRMPSVRRLEGPRGPECEG